VSISNPGKVELSPETHDHTNRISIDRLWSYGIWIVLIVLVLVISLFNSTFRSTSNLTNVLEQNSMLGIVAAGMLVMMVSGGFDLSVGAIGASASVAGAELSLHFGLAVAIPGMIIVGLAVGLANGLLIAKVRINAFVTTFAMASIVTGILFTATSASPINANAGWLGTLALGTIGGIPWAFIGYAIVMLITWILLARTKLGHYIYSVGGNREASFLSGIPVVSSQILAFVYGGLCASLGGLILIGQANIGQPSSATDWPLSAIAICVIGGVSLSGGVGRVQGVVAATFLLGVISNALSLFNVSPYIQPTITGAVIVLAVMLDKVSQSRSSSR
jgi:ribose/xylose/arabinose/galactoside ABC-type transport system permease subunit